MLGLSRKPKQCIVIGDNIRVYVTRVQHDKVSLAIEAPPEIPVHRGEVWDKIQSPKQGGDDAQND